MASARDLSAVGDIADEARYVMKEPLGKITAKQVKEITDGLLPADAMYKRAIEAARAQYARRGKRIFPVSESRPIEKLEEVLPGPNRVVSAPTISRDIRPACSVDLNPV